MHLLNATVVKIYICKMCVLCGVHVVYVTYICVRRICDRIQLLGKYDRGGVCVGPVFPRVGGHVTPGRVWWAMACLVRI